MKEFFKVYKNISEVSADLIRTGIIISIVVLLIGIFVYNFNEYFIGSYQNREYSFQIVQKAWSLFVIFILGGIALDCYSKSCWMTSI